MRKQLKTAMTILIAVQSAIEIAKFVAKSYRSIKNRKKSAEEVDTTPQTAPANDPIRKD